MATVTKSLKKEIIKNHLLGLDEDENLSKLASSGEQVDSQTVRQVIDEFGSEMEKNGLDVAKSYGVTRFANELAEVAKFKRKNEIELDDMMRGARVARVLKNYGVGIPELEQFLTAVYSRAEEKGYSAEAIVDQVSTLKDLEKKHDASFEVIKSEYESLGTDLKSKHIERNELLQEVDDLKRKKSEVLAQSELDELKIKEYDLTKERLVELGFQIEGLETVKQFLLAIKSQGFDPIKTIATLNSIGDLEKRKLDLETQANVAETDLQKKESLLTEITKLERSSLTLEQVENIRNIIESISSSRGIDASEAYRQFEGDMVDNYDAVLGLKATLSRLRENEKQLTEEADAMKQQLASEQSIQSEKMRQLEQEYSRIAGEIKSYKDLVAMGLDANKMSSWHEIIETSNIDFERVEAELKRNANLKNMEREFAQKVAALTSEAISLKETVEQLSKEKVKIESSIKAIGENAIAELESVNSAIVSSIANLGENAKSAVSQIASENEKVLNDFRASTQIGTEKAIENAKVGLQSTVSQLNTSVVEFSVNLKKSIEEAAPQIKSLSGALEAGEKLGKYRNIMPLLELLDEKNVSESEALIAMWNVVNRFNAWVAEHYKSSPKPEISETLSKLVAHINDEVQRINQQA